MTDAIAWRPSNESFEEWSATLQRFGRVHHVLKFFIVDCYLWGEARFGERAVQVASSLGWAPHTLLNAIAVARAFPPELRHPELSFGHHDAVAALDGPTRTGLLQKAHEFGWTVEDLREAVREGKGLMRRQPPVRRIIAAGDALAQTAAAFVTMLLIAETTPGEDRPSTEPLSQAVVEWHRQRGMK